MARIPAVDEVKAFLFHADGQEWMTVSAIGTVPTTGWTNPHLARLLTIAPPTDGIVDFDFDITPPTGIVGDIVLHVSASLTIPVPRGTKGARVFAQSNSKEALAPKTLETRKVA